MLVEIIMEELHQDTKKQVQKNYIELLISKEINLV